jgi:hypothetical protein
MTIAWSTTALRPKERAKEGAKEEASILLGEKDALFWVSQQTFKLFSLLACAAFALPATMSSEQKGARNAQCRTCQRLSSVAGRNGHSWHIHVISHSEYQEELLLVMYAFCVPAHIGEPARGAQRLYG